MIGLRRFPHRPERRTPGTYGRTRSDSNTRAGTASAHHHRRRGGGRSPRCVHRALGVLRRRPVVPRGRPLRACSGRSFGPRSCSGSRSGSCSSCSCSRTCGSSVASRPRFHALTPEQEIIERYRMQFEPYIRWLLPAVRAGDRGLRRAGGHDPVADVPAVAQRLRVVVREPRAAVRARSRLLRVHVAVAEVRAGVAVLGAGRRDVPDRARALPVGRDPAAGAGLRRQGDAAGQGAHVGAAGPDHAREGVGLLPRAVRPPDLHPRGRGRRLLHRRERAAARAPDPGGDRDRLRDPVPGQHPAAWVGVARHRGRPARARVHHRRSCVPRVRATVPRHATGVPAGTAVHRGQHLGDQDGPSSSTASPPRRVRWGTRSPARTPVRTTRRSRTSACGAPTSFATTTSRCSGSVPSTSSTTSTSIATSSTESAAS